MRGPVGAGPGALPRTLDTLAAGLGVHWRYHHNAIEFYRMQTRVFDVRALTLARRADARLGRAGTTEAGGFDTTSNTALSSGEHHALQAVRVRILPFLPTAGTPAAPHRRRTSPVVHTPPAPPSP